MELQSHAALPHLSTVLAEALWPQVRMDGGPRRTAGTFQGTYHNGWWISSKDSSVNDFWRELALLERKHARRGLVEGCALQGGVTECPGAWGRPGGVAICPAWDSDSPPTPVLSRSHQTQSWFSASLQRSAELREVLRQCASGPRCMLWKDDAPGEVGI